MITWYVLIRIVYIISELLLCDDLFLILKSWLFLIFLLILHQIVKFRITNLPNAVMPFIVTLHISFLVVIFNLRSWVVWLLAEILWWVTPLFLLMLLMLIFWVSVFVILPILLFWITMIWFNCNIGVGWTHPVRSLRLVKFLHAFWLFRLSHRLFNDRVFVVSAWFDHVNILIRI